MKFLISTPKHMINRKQVRSRQEQFASASVNKLKLLQEATANSFVHTWNGPLQQNTTHNSQYGKGKAEFADRSNCKITPDHMQMQRKQLSLDSHRENLACKARVLLKQLSDVVLHFSHLFLKVFLRSLIIR